MIVDFHVHLFPPQIKEDRTPYLQRDAGFRQLYDSPKARIATADELLLSMDEAGIDVSVIQGFGWSTQDLCHEHNDYLLEAATLHPDRLIPFCTVQPLAGQEAIAEILRCVSAGTLGVGELRPEDQGFDTHDWAALGGIADWVGERPLPLLIHASEPVGHQYAGKGLMTPDKLYKLITVFPNSPVILAHLGGGLPFYAAMPEVQTALEHTWVDTAAWPFLYNASVFPALVDLFGGDKMLFASDFPLLSQQRVLDATRALPLPPNVLDDILGNNAARLLGLEE